jgi:hypothetical protein
MEMLNLLHPGAKFSWLANKGSTRTEPSKELEEEEEELVDVAQ